MEDKSLQLFQAYFDQVTDFDEGTDEFCPNDSDQESSRKELVEMIIIHEYPLKMVEHEGFKNFVKSLNPCIKLGSRDTIRNDCLKLYDGLKEDMKHVISNCESRVAITIDMWTSSYKKREFMAVTAHYIDDDWKLQNRIIGFIYVPSPHTSEALCEALFDCFLEWDIDINLSTITVDSCSTNDTMITLLREKLKGDLLLIGGKLLHMRCCAHILNLIAKDGLDVIGAAIEKVRDSFSYWSGTPKRWKMFESDARQRSIELIEKLLLDCETRWNSTYMMLETAVSYKDVFCRLKCHDSEYTYLPSEDEWNLITEVCGRLKVFYNVTELFSGTQCPTANLLFPKICEIKLALSQWSTCGVEVVESMSSNMKIKFDRYWSDVRDVMGVATVFDPRYKLLLLEYYFQKIYGTEGENEVEKILSLCLELLIQYEAKDKINGGASFPVKTNVADVPSLREFDMFVSTRKRENFKSELDQYLEEDVLPRTLDFDVLAWWKCNGGKYPMLHQIARDVLAIPLSTVASESAFSSSGRSISPHRSRLHHNTIQALMCSRNWLLSKEENSMIGADQTALFDSDDEQIELEVF